MYPTLEVTGRLRRCDTVSLVILALCLMLSHDLLLYWSVSVLTIDISDSQPLTL